MSDKRSDEPRDGRSRRGFLRTLGGALAGAMVAGGVGAQAKDPRVPRRPAGQLGPRRLTGVKGSLRPVGGDETRLPPYKPKRKPPVDAPPDYGPLIVMEPPGYDPAPAGTTPYLYADRFFEAWKDHKPDWFGAGQLGEMKAPTWGWMTTTPPPPGWCAVATIWNKGREPSFSAMMRALCFAIAPSGPGEWTEVVRADLGYVHVGALTPGDYIEVRYPVTTVRDGMKQLDDYLMREDRGCSSYPQVWYFHKCFAFDPLRDPMIAQPPIKAPDPPRSVIGGRHAAGWRWEAPAQTAGQTRVRHFG